MPGYTITFARSARKELQSLPMDVAADKTLSALSTNVPTSNQQALRATEKNYPTGFTGLCRISFLPESADEKHVNPVNPV